MVFLLAKQGRYFYDAEAVREQPNTDSLARYGRNSNYDRTLPYKMDTAPKGNLSGANARNVWTIPTQGRSDAHFATFPDELPRRCILAGTSERGVCADCGAPWVRQVQTTLVKERPNPSGTVRDAYSDGKTQGANRARDGHTMGHNSTQTLGWQPTCGCNADTLPATVLDPFAGSGTTLAVAQALGRKSVGLDLNPEYLELAAKRIGGISLPMAL